MSNQNRSINKFRLFTAFLAVVAIMLTAGMYTQPVSAQGPGLTAAKPKNDLPTPSVEPESFQKDTYTVIEGQVQRDLVLTGELKAKRSIVIMAPDVRSSFGGMVMYLPPEGSYIKKGERLVEFDDSDLLSQQSEAERSLDETLLNIEKTKMDLESQRSDLLNSIAQAESQLEQDELYGRIDKELLPANTHQRYQVNLEKSKLALEKAKEQYDNFEKTFDSEVALSEVSRTKAEINLKKILNDMAMLKVDAPQDGIVIYGDNFVSNRKIQPGDQIFPGQEVVSLPDLSSMQVIGYVHDTEYGSIVPDTRCTVRFDALPDFQSGGRIVSITNVATNKSRFYTDQKVFLVTVALDKNDPEIMKPGMTARIDIPLILARNTPTVPREYLGTDSDGGFYVVTGTDAKKAAKQPVEIGAVGDRVVEIVSGVSAGEPLYPVY